MKIWSSWKVYPAPVILSEIGEKWIKEAKSIVLRAPGCIVQTTHNYILNCRHPEYSKVSLIERTNFDFDSRLKK